MGQNGKGPDRSVNPISSKGPRCIALVGPFQSGKTTLLEAILARTGAIPRQGSVEAGTTVGDASKEARHHKMSVEASVRHHHLHGRQLHFHRLSRLDRVRSRHALRAAGGRRRRRRLRGGREEDAATAADPARTRRPEHSALPVSQQDRQGRQARARNACKLLQPASRVPLLLRQIPIWNGTASFPASSISRLSARMSTRSTPPPR